MNEYRPIGIDTAINLLAEVFGAHYVISNQESGETIIGYNATSKNVDQYDRLSQFGTPVIGSFWAVNGDLPYKVYDNDGRLIDREFTDFEFPVATIVDFSRPKNITKTPTIGSGGTVKEIFGSDDWKINIRGICIDDSSRTMQKTAKQQQYALIRMFDIAGSIKIKGKIFEEKYISRIAIERLDITPVQGKPGLTQYEMECSSDEDFLIMSI